MPAVAPVDKPELPPPPSELPVAPVDVAALEPDVAGAVAAVKSEDLYSNTTCSAETVKTASPDTETFVASTLTHVRSTGVLGPKAKAVVDDGHSDRPLTCDDV